MEEVKNKMNNRIIYIISTYSKFLKWSNIFNEKVIFLYKEKNNEYLYLKKNTYDFVYYTKSGFKKAETEINIPALKRALSINISSRLTNLYRREEELINAQCKLLLS